MTPLSNDMECAGSTALSNPVAPQSKSSVEPEHSKEPSAQSKSGVESLRDPSDHRTPNDFRCKYCNSTDVVRAGTRKLKSGVKQLYKCNDCLRKFSSLHRNSKQTDPDIILKTLIAACRSYTYEEIQRFVERRYQKKISASAISKWVKEYNPPYLKMRARNDTVSKIVISNVFTHREINYNFQIHVPKLAGCPLRQLKDYLVKLPNFIDHHFFETADRCSWIKTDLNIAVKHSQSTQACKDALKALQFAKTNFRRHDVVEQFMLNCDRYTIACEIPVWMDFSECGGLTPLSNNMECAGLTPLSNAHAQTMECAGLTELSNPVEHPFQSGVESLRDPAGHRTPAPSVQSGVEPPHSTGFTIAGHIDLLQWKFDTLYILDFKPDAKKENRQKVASQLYLYALSLSIRANVPLNRMRCAWFAGEDFFSFAPVECGGSTPL